MLDESRMDTSKPYVAVQSTAEIDNDIQATLKEKRDSFEEGSDDYQHYDNEYNDFKNTFRGYHDTYVMGEDDKGRTFIVHVTNKKRVIYLILTLTQLLEKGSNP